jgi:protocatechuate 3,4-dioxygenase beta subunit
MRRREFLFGSFGLLVACGHPAARSEDLPDLGRALPDLLPTAQCEETEDNTEGPYYRAGAPMRSDLRAPGVAGSLLALDGRVFSSAACAPLAGATLDFWQADGDANYDNTGYTLRGKQLATEGGGWDLRTVIPGHYLNGAQYRPAHIHVKVSAPGHAPLTTQLYFVGDPYNDIDPFYKPSLEMVLADGSDGKVGAFDFVLRKL